MIRFSRNNLLSWILVGCFSLSLTSVTFSIQIKPVYGQNIIERILRRFTQRPKRDARPATVSRGGGNRDRCPYTDQELVALMPESEETGLPYLEQTVEAYPTWYFYVPYKPKIGRKIEFVLIDVNEDIIYQEKFTLKNSPGILRLSLPKNISGFTNGLESNQLYRWVFSIICNESNRSGDATVNGWLERIPSPLQTTIPTTTKQKNHYRIYAENLIWFDVVNELANLRISYPEDPVIEENWNALLNLLRLRNLPSQISSIN